MIEKVLVFAEKCFRHETDISDLQQIDIKKGSYDLFNFKCIKDYFLETVEESAMEQNSTVRDNILRLDVFQLQKSVTN